MVDQFKAEKNIAHYQSRLEIGAEPETRSVLLNKLLDEEKTLGRTRERLARLDGHIARLQHVIAQQEKRISRFKFIGINSGRATLILSTFNDLMATYQLNRQWITAGLVDGNGT